MKTNTFTLYRAERSNEYDWSIHRTGCSAAARETWRPNTKPVGEITGDSVNALIREWFDEELVGMGYGLESVRIHACCGKVDRLEDPRENVVCPGCERPYSVAYPDGCSWDNGCAKELPEPCSADQEAV